jgi:NADPH:quinone reductase-like Zn-dependent oxidoreductase
MKAAVITRYGSPEVVRVQDAPKPSPAANEVLIRVHAATVNRTDCGELTPRSDCGGLPLRRNGAESQHRCGRS